MAEDMSHYHILKKIGGGGMGEVYLAQDTNLDRTVALKILPSEVASDPTSMRRFVQEAKAAAILSHPNVCVIYEVADTEDGRLFIAMEYIEGEALNVRIGEGSLEVTDIISIGIQVAEALDEAHSKGIIHRDIKPSNILITPRGQVKVVDFGLAKVTASKLQSPASDLTTQVKSGPGMAMGTLPYMSPEQALGRAVDHRTDLFSLGVVLYEMATGNLPFKGNTPAAVFDAILHSVPTSPMRLNPAVPTELEHIINKALEKDQKVRYQTASDLRADLERLKRASESGEAIKSIPAAARPRLYRRLAGPAGGVLLALLLVVLLVNVKNWLRVDRVPAEKHLAVLSFSNVGNDPNNQALCDGLVEILTSKVTQLERFHARLWVVPASEVMSTGTRSVSEAQRQFGVTLVVTGSVQLFGDRVRVTMNLVDAGTQRQLRSEIFDESLENVMALQDGIVSTLAGMLDVELKPQVTGVLAAGQTTVPRAYDFYLRGRGYLVRYEKTENLAAAIALFEQALKEDPNYALAFAGLGEAYWRQFDATKDMRWVGMAVANCDRAVGLNSQLPPVHVTLGLVHAGTGQLEEAIQDFQRALALDPVNADAHAGLAKTYDQLGWSDKAEVTFKKAIELRPGYWSGYNDLGRFYYFQGRYSDALTQYLKVVELTPDNFWGFNNLGGIYIMLERPADARTMFERAIEIKPNDGAFSNLGRLYFDEGRYADAARMYERALSINDRRFGVWRNLAMAYSYLPGSRQKMQDALRHAVRMGEERRNMNPRDPDVLIELASCYAMTGERQKAVPLLEQALDLAPDRVEFMVIAGEIFEKFREREQALRWIGKALEHDFPLEQIEGAPNLRELCADPRFQKIVQSSRRVP